MINEVEHYENIVRCLNEMITNRNIESLQHIRYVQGYTGILATEYAKVYPKSRMTKEKIAWIVEAAGVHDIGKIMMPDILISRVGRLSKAETERMKEHTIKGYEMVKYLFDFREDDFCRICQNVCLYHHEKYDGSGYPRGLKKDRIPIEAQIVSVADMYEVMVHNERNDMLFSKEKVYYMLMNGECGELSPRMRECLESAKEQLEQLRIHM